MADAVLLALMRQLIRQGVLSSLDIEAMTDDLGRQGKDDEAHSVNVCFIEACALEASDGGNSTA